MVSEQARHVVEQSFAAVRELALGPGTLAGRLEGACDALLSVESVEVPEPLREEFKGLITDIAKVEEFSVLPDSDAMALALRFLLFHERVLLSE